MRAKFCLRFIPLAPGASKAPTGVTSDAGSTALGIPESIVNILYAGRPSGVGAMSQPYIQCVDIYLQYVVASHSEGLLMWNPIPDCEYVQSMFNHI